MHISPHEASRRIPTVHDLGGVWTCRAARGPIPSHLEAVLRDGIAGTVPGVVHLDLLAADLIPDPYDGDNESALTWIGRTDWEYSRSFTWEPDSHTDHDLVAEGLDTVARIWLNGQLVGDARNHHRSYRFPVHDHLRAGTNDLRVEFRGALSFAEEREAVLGVRPHSNPHPFNCIRKPAYAFGWDWGPEIVTAGIWRPLRLEGRSGARMTQLRRRTRWTGAGGELLVDVEVDRGHPPLSLDVEVEGRRVSMPVSDGAASVCLEVPDAQAWWPRSHGEQPLYPARIRLTDADGDCLDEWRGRVGFRSVTLDTSPDADGNRFTVAVNGRPIYVRGANWIPADTYLPRVTRETLASSLHDATDAGMNLIRVWGGGIYESDDFYDLCDELGLLVWQDFTLACAAYAEDPELWDEFEAEAAEAIVRLAAHPSLALLNGGNENIWGWADWGWRRALDGATWGEGYYMDLFPGLVRRLADEVPYSEGSPFSFDRYLHPNQDSDGCMHIWDVWNSRDYTAYRTYRPRFVSEFGFQAPPAFATLESVVHDEPRSPFGAQMLVHQKAESGNLKLERGLGDHLPLPTDYVDWHWATQLNQARAVRFGVEYFRSLAPFNTGSIVWQLNDCWPVVSWSAVDSLGRRKPLWFALREAFADRLCSIQPRDGGLSLTLHNESDEPWTSTATVRRIDVEGRHLAVQIIELQIDPRASLVVPLDTTITQSQNACRELVVADLSSGQRAFWYFEEDTRLELAADPVTATAEELAGGYRVTVTAHALTKDLTLLVDHADPDATVDRGLVTLLPGDEVVFTVSSTRPHLTTRLTGAPVLRTANDLVAPRQRRTGGASPQPVGIDGSDLRAAARRESLAR